VMECLLQQQFAVMAGGQTDEADLMGQILGHLERARADGTGGTKKDDSLHVNNPQFRICRSCAFWQAVVQWQRSEVKRDGEFSGMVDLN
jgi:hypothetical protein